MDTLLHLVQTLAPAMSVVAAIAAWVSARAASRAADATRRASQGGFLCALLDDYASPEMLAAMIKLRSWVAKHGSRFPDEFRQMRMKNYAAVKEIDQARRRVSHFFYKVSTLYKAGFLEEQAVCKAATRGQVEFLREIVEPLEAALNPQYSRDTFETLGGLYGIEEPTQELANPTQA